MEKPPFISVIICTYNRAGYLHDTLQSLLKTSAEPESFETIIIDNNSKDTTESISQEVIQSHPEYSVRYVQESNQGLSYARNRGIKEASAPILLFLDDDIVAHPGFIPAWISFFRNYPQASGGGGKISVQFDDPCPAWMSRFLLPLLGHHDLGNNIKKYPANKYPFGGNMAFKERVFDQYGDFHTGLGRKAAQLMASEEKEFYGRLAETENIFYLPDASLYHRVDKHRLTKTYIKKQAIGLGKSIALQQKKDSTFEKIMQLGSEMIKILGTIVLCSYYSLLLQFSKAGMLITFRRWIWKGYRQIKF